MNTRRTFLRWATFGLGSVVSVLPLGIRRAIAASPAPFEKVGTVADLDKNGFVAGKLASGTPVLVIKDPKDAKALIAVNSTCTHAGCASEWNAKDSLFVCPCHGSRFQVDGKVARGPAGKPLGVLQAKIDKDTVVVSG